MLERIINPTKKTIGAALVCGAVNLLGGCKYPDQDLKIKPIEDQVVIEGESLALYLSNYILKPDSADINKIKVKSGPGIIQNKDIFFYYDKLDNDNIDNRHTVKLEFIYGDKKIHRTFNITQQDKYALEEISPGIEAITLGDDTLFVGPFRRNQTSIAVNSKDEPFIIYYEQSGPSSTLRYAELKNGFWGGDRITSPRWSSWGYNSVVMDSQDKARVSFTIFTQYRGEDLYYATDINAIDNTNYRWEMEQVDGNDSVGLENSIALDSLGNVHISHWAWAGARSKYSSNNSGAWANEILDYAGWQQTSIAIDALDKVHIAYVGWNPSRTLYHITNKSGAWEKTLINSNSNPVLLIDSQGAKHIISADSRAIYHSTDQSGNWVTQQAINHDPEYVCLDARLSGAIADDDSILITYIVSGTDPAEYISKPYFATNRTGNWKTYLLDDKPAYANPSIAVDNKGNAHISVIGVIDQSKGIIKYITFDPSQL